MRKVFVTALLLASFVLPVKADQWGMTVKKVQNAVLYVENEEGSCTAFVIDAAKQYVMSAAHCYGNQIWVDRVAGEVIALDTKKDLMVLEVKNLDPAKTALKMAAKDPEIRQDVMSVGYGYGLERPFFKTAHVSDTEVRIPGIGGPFIGVDASFTPGQSGGPVVDINGNLVSIVQMGDGGTLGIGVGVDIIRERMGRFFASEAPKK
jgi:serine protease Do